MALRFVRGMIVAATLLVACDGASSTKQPAPRDDRSLCAALCEHLAECAPATDFPGAATCTRRCVEDQPRPPAACHAARVDYEVCAIPLPCDQLRTLYVEPTATTSPCAAEVAALLACDPSQPVPHIDFQF